MVVLLLVPGSVFIFVRRRDWLASAELLRLLERFQSLAIVAFGGGRVSLETVQRLDGGFGPERASHMEVGGRLGLFGSLFGVSDGGVRDHDVEGFGFDSAASVSWEASKFSSSGARAKLWPISAWRASKSSWRSPCKSNAVDATNPSSILLGLAMKSM